jgi:hypothetical protein
MKRLRLHYSRIILMLRRESSFNQAFKRKVWHDRENTVSKNLVNCNLPCTIVLEFKISNQKQKRMKNSKTLLTLLVIAGMYLLNSCCPESCYTEEKCRTMYGMIKPDECPSNPGTSPCPDGQTLMSIPKADAQAYIAAAKEGSPSFVSGMNVNPCQIYLLSQQSQDVFIILGKKPDNSAVIIGKYYLSSGDSAYADVTNNITGGPTCPPSYRCN